MNKEQLKWIIPVGFIVLGLIIIESKTKYIEKELILPLKYRVVNNWLPHIQYYSEIFNVDPAFVASIMYQESRGNPLAISSAGAIGLMQIMPKTGKGVCGFDVEHLKNPEYNIYCGIKYIAHMWNKFKDYKWVAAGFYGGEGTPPTSTKGKPPVYKYVSDVINHFNYIKTTVKRELP